MDELVNVLFAIDNAHTAPPRATLVSTWSERRHSNNSWR